MGTNYYLQRQDPVTKRAFDIHICKISAGWPPLFEAYTKNDYKVSFDVPEIKSLMAWKFFLKSEIDDFNGIIFNEYDEPIDFDEFIDIIENAQKKNFDTFFHTYNSKDKIENNDWFLDPNLYRFTFREFS